MLMSFVIVSVLADVSSEYRRRVILHISAQEPVNGFLQINPGIS